jgi:hypothetical protein
VAKTQTIRLLDALTEYSEFHTGIFLTYNADLAFFEEAVLYPLWQNGCRNVLVFLDGDRYVDTVTDMRGSVTWAGRRYVLIPISLGPLQAFHPKLILLLGHERGRLLVGSGNVTFSGFGHNHEVYTCLDWTSEEPNLQDVFGQAWHLINRILDQWGHSNVASKALRKAEYVADWLTQPSDPVIEIQLFHTLDEALIDQCSRALKNETINRITVLTPFLDESARALSELGDRFRPKELRLVLQDQKVVGNVQALESLRQAGVPLKVHRFKDEKRYLHAKTYIFEAAKAAFAVTGSANCTSAAWLASCADGNLEVALLRHANSHHHFDSLLKEHIVSRTVTSLEEIRTRSLPLPASEGEPAAVHLLDLSIVDNQLAVVFSMSALDDNVADLQLRLSTTPSHLVSLGLHGVGMHSLRFPVPAGLHLPARPISSSMWGVDTKGQLLDLGCNELWVTNADVISYEATRAMPIDPGTGNILADMEAGSEDEWHDLYQSLARLVVLDVTELKRRGGGYITKPPKKKPKSKRRAEEEEVEIWLVDESTDEEKEAAEAVYHESALYAWLEHVRGRLPGAARDKPGSPTPPKPGNGGPGPKFKPSRDVGRQFLNLVKKYITSLANVEYMRTASIYHILDYYAVFQRIVWFLLGHEAIEVEDYVRLATDINAGFFGLPEEGPPVLNPCLYRHIQRVWEEEWRNSEVPFYALVSVVMSERLVRQIADDELKNQVSNQALRVLSGIATVVDITRVMEDTETTTRITRVYDEDAEALCIQVMARIENSLSEIGAVLEGWSCKVAAALAGTNESSQTKLLLRARVDYGIACYRIIRLLQHTETQIRLCSDLVFWMRRAGNLDAAREYGDQLVSLLQAQGHSQEVAQALCNQGTSLFLDHQYEDAANKLRQASFLAESLGDRLLREKCDQFLGYTEFFLR